MFASPLERVPAQPTAALRSGAAPRPAAPLPSHGPGGSHDFSGLPCFPAGAQTAAVTGSASRHANEAEARQAADLAQAHLQAATPPMAEHQPDGVRPLPVTAPLGSGEPLSPARRRPLERAFGYDLTAIRVHDDARARVVARGLGAAAFAVGPHIVLDRSRADPGGPIGRHVLAHEVAHVIQTALQPAAPAIHLFESPEHEDLGDAALPELLAFLRTAPGKAWASSRGLKPEQLIAQIEADPLKKAAGTIVAGTRTVNGKREEVRLSPGEITALSGDFYANPAAIATAAAQAPEKAGRGSELDQLRNAIGDERRGTLADANSTYNQITKGRYLELAKSNDEHFAPLNRVAWRRLHDQAIAEAATNTEAALQHALLVDAAGGHFLTDAYASGHLFRKGELVDAIKRYLAANPLRTQNPEAQTYAAIVTLSGDAYQLVLKGIHDRMNQEGFAVSNAAGMTWQTYGDAMLARAPDTSRIAGLALFTSRQQIYEAHKGGKPDPKQVEALMPDDATLDGATKQAISYIPAAAADVQAVMYKGRNLAVSQFPPVLGSIIGRNLATIASPGRERQLLDLQQSSATTPTGPRLAPQFTVGSW